PVYLTLSILERRTASGRGGPWHCAEHPTARTYFEGLCPQTEALVARSVIVPVGVGYSETDCDHVASSVRTVADKLLSCPFASRSSAAEPLRITFICRC